VSAVRLLIPNFVVATWSATSGLRGVNFRRTARDFNGNGIGEACECEGRCGDPQPAIGKVTAGDAQFILRAAVQLVTCPLCLCDVNHSESILSSDALLDLRFAVGLPEVLDCTADE
jgi:hypothetical protein